MLAEVSYDYTPTGWYATFDPKEHPQRHVQRAIEAWSPEGKALIVDEQTGRLVAANMSRGFTGIRPCSQVAQVIPAAPGWQMNFPADESIGCPEPWVRPVIAWVVDTDGEAKPLLPLDDGTASAQGWPSNGTLTWPGKDVASPDAVAATAEDEGTETAAPGAR
jgi:hypothetical protein